MKKSKKLKGMTLIECIVALAVFTVFTSGMATAVAGLCTIRRSTDETVRKTTYQSRWADNRVSGNCDETKNCEITVSSTSTGYTQTFIADKYTAKTAQTDRAGKVLDIEGNEAFSTGKEIAWATDSTPRNFQYYDGIVVKP